MQSPPVPLHVLPFAFCQASQVWYSHFSAQSIHPDHPHSWTEEETGRLWEWCPEISRTGMSKSSPSIHRQGHCASLCLCRVIGHHLASLYVPVTLPHVAIHPGLGVWAQIISGLHMDPTVVNQMENPERGFWQHLCLVMDHSLPLWLAFTFAQLITIHVGQFQTQVPFWKK